MNKQKSQLRKAIPKLFKSAPCMEQSSRLEVLFKKGGLRNLQNSQENACARVSFLIKLQAYSYSVV